MPEGIEAELYRRAAEHTVGRTIAAMPVSDPLCCGVLAGSPAVLVGRTITGARRHGKQVLLDLDDGHVLGLHFGMSGRLIVDGVAAIDRLLYASSRNDAVFVRFELRFVAGGSLMMIDPRRLGRVSVDPDVDKLGPDVFGLTHDQLAAALAGSAVPVKARLLDQSRIAGLGNLLTDEVLWRAGLDPVRPCSSLASAEIAALSAAIRRVVTLLSKRGGSHLGDLQDSRVPGGCCPTDGTPLERRTIGGRTTFSCPGHQR